MQKFTLENGLKVIFKQKKGNSVVVQVMVNIGSNHETADERGISHFLEHLLFEGTEKRPTNQLISNEIEKIGGEFNAYTTNERTCFYVKVLKKYFHKAVEILADILQNPLFKEEHIAKEKKIVLKEIAMLHDEPSCYQWILLQKNLFIKHPCKNPTYGSKKIIKALTKDKVSAFFNTHYVPQNMTVSIVGDIPAWKEKISKYFVKSVPGKTVKKPLVKEPAATKNTIKKEKKKIANSYLVLGFKTAACTNKDAYALKVVDGILGRGQSGRMFTEIRSKRGLAYDVGTQNVAEISFGYFAAYATINKKNITLVRKIMIQEIEKLKSISKKDLKEAKDYLEGNYLLELEESQKVADQLLFWEQAKDARLMMQFVKNIKKVTDDDVRRVVDKYFKHYTMVVLEGK